LRLLETELRAIAAKDGTVELAVADSEITVDGTRPKATARARHPGVILSFGSKHGPLRIACDRFTGWQDNVRAIALGLHDLRRLDRYGIVRRGEQYRGWRALPAASGAPCSREEAAAVLARFSSFAVVEVLNGKAREAYLAAAGKVHPDRGGSEELFCAVKAAADFLEVNP